MMRRWDLFPVFFCFILVACSGKETTVKEHDPLADFDTLYLQPSSSFSINRYRIYLNKNAKFRLGKLNVNMTIKDLETGVASAYTIDSGMLVYNKTYFTAHCYINTNQVKTLQIDSSNQLQLQTPQYLLRHSKPYFKLEYQGNFFPKDQAPAATCYLILNDSTALLNNAQNQVESKNNRVSAIKTQAYVDGLKWKLFEPVEGEVIRQDSISLNVELFFDKR